MSLTRSGESCNQYDHGHMPKASTIVYTYAPWIPDDDNPGCYVRHIMGKLGKRVFADLARAQSTNPEERELAEAGAKENIQHALTSNK